MTARLYSGAPLNWSAQGLAADGLIVYDDVMPTLKAVCYSLKLSGPEGGVVSLSGSGLFAPLTITLAPTTVLADVVKALLPAVQTRGSVVALNGYGTREADGLVTIELMAFLTLGHDKWYRTPQLFGVSASTGWTVSERWDNANSIKFYRAMDGLNAVGPSWWGPDEVLAGAYVDSVTTADAPMPQVGVPDWFTYTKALNALGLSEYKPLVLSTCQIKDFGPSGTITTTPGPSSGGSGMGILNGILKLFKSLFKAVFKFIKRNWAWLAVFVVIAAVFFPTVLPAIWNALSSAWTLISSAFTSIGSAYLGLYSGLTLWEGVALAAGTAFILAPDQVAETVKDAGAAIGTGIGAVVGGAVGTAASASGLSSVLMIGAGLFALYIFMGHKKDEKGERNDQRVPST